MSEEKPSVRFPKIAQFEWDEQRSQAAIGLAAGKTQEEIASEVGCSRRTIVNWLQHVDFAGEVDRLSLMTEAASRAERLRITKRVIRQKLEGSKIETEKDLLDWLKFAQSETDGVKLDLGKLAASFAQDETPMADRGSATGDSAAESAAVN